MIVAIHAFDNMFCGLHGMEAFFVTEVENETTARMIARDMSSEVIMSYGDIYEDFEEGANYEGLEPDTLEYEDFIEQCVQEDIAYEIWKVTSNLKSIKEMCEDFENDMEEFLTKHDCREIV